MPKESQNIEATTTIRVQGGPFGLQLPAASGKRNSQVKKGDADVAQESLSEKMGERFDSGHVGRVRLKIGVYDSLSSLQDKQ